jgi:hypothetical protein
VNENFEHRDGGRDRANPSGGQTVEQPVRQFNVSRVVLDLINENRSIQPDYPVPGQEVFERTASYSQESRSFSIWVPGYGFLAIPRIAFA